MLFSEKKSLLILRIVPDTNVYFKDKNVEFLRFKAGSIHSYLLLLLGQKNYNSIIMK